LISNHKIICIDIDGVLISSVEYYANLYKKVSEEMWWEIWLPYETYHQLVWKPVDQALYMVPVENREKALELFDEYNEETRINWNYQEVEWATEFLQSLKKIWKKVALVSSKSRVWIELLLKHFDWWKLIDFSISWDEVIEFKPNPDCLIKTMNFFECDKKDMIMIWDSLHDLYSAKNFEIDFIWVLTGVCNETQWKNEWIEYKKSVLKINN